MLVMHASCRPHQTGHDVPSLQGGILHERRHMPLRNTFAMGRAFFRHYESPFKNETSGNNVSIIFFLSAKVDTDHDIYTQLHVKNFRGEVEIPETPWGRSPRSRVWPLVMIPGYVNTLRKPLISRHFQSDISIISTWHFNLCSFHLESDGLRDGTSTTTADVGT